VLLTYSFTVSPTFILQIVQGCPSRGSPQPEPSAISTSAQSLTRLSGSAYKSGGGYAQQIV